MLTQAPDFWTDRGFVSTMLLPLAALYGAVAAARMRGRRSEKAGIPVIVVGNLVIGGAGKTPTAFHIAERLAAMGGRPFIVMRGFGGRLAGPIRVDPEVHAAADVGDEARMLALRGLPIVVARDRAAGVRLAAGQWATHAVLDDGFQSRAVAADRALLVVDTGYGIGNGRVFPAGPLRAPLAAQLGEPVPILLVGDGEAPDFGPCRPARLFRGRLVPRDPDRWTGRRVYGFAGIGRPEKLRESLLGLGADVVGFRGYPDHHVVTDPQAATLLTEADRLGATLVTTAKDKARLGAPSGGPLAVLAANAEVLEVDLVTAPPDALARWLDEGP